MDLCDFSTLNIFVSPMSVRLKSLVFVVACLCPLMAQAESDALHLKLDRTFKMMSATKEKTAAFIKAQSVQARKGQELQADGDVELRQGGQVVSADHLTYDQDNKQVNAEGSVRMDEGTTSVSGPSLKLNLDSNTGEITQPVFLFSEPTSRGSAQVMHIEGKGLYLLDDATFTTCPIDRDDWLLKANSLEINRNTQTGVAHNARVEFQGVPILYTPWMDFPLSNDRRSGLLGPTLGGTSAGGTEITLPYYLNLSPNMDATISPRFMQRRGTLFSNEFRYLEPSYSGEFHLDMLPNDRVRQMSRSRQMVKHNQNLGGGLSLAVNMQHVSDDNYYRDISDTINGSSQVNLPREGVLSYNRGWWNASARAQTFQTLQDPLAPIAIPYSRLPQVSFSGRTSTFSVGNLNLMGEYVDFRHPTSINGQRAVFYPSLTLPLMNDPAIFLTPKIGMHGTHYELGDNNTTGIRSASRSLPIFSLDSGLVFERESTLAGIGYTQTLEPRAFYVNIPYRNQDALPVFDTAQAPFNFGQIFTENRFFGNDRVGDADMLTTAVTTRFIDNDGGLERLRIMLGERFSFRQPQVNLVAQTESTSKSDLLLGVSGRMTRELTLDSLIQYNPNLTRTEAYNVSARYRAEAGKVVNFGYRFTRDTLRQGDVSAQLPILGGWHLVARLNYSFLDLHALEALAGLEYNKDCWAARMVAQQFTTATQQTSTGIFIQLDLNGLGGLGADPLEALRRSVFGYTKMNDLPADKPIQGLR
jgi:LPS-assembly protein